MIDSISRGIRALGFSSAIGTDGQLITAMAPTFDQGE